MLRRDRGASNELRPILSNLESFGNHRGTMVDPDHPRGRHKARVFASALGLTKQDAPMLQQKLLDVAYTHEAIRTKVDAYGVRYQIDFEMESEAGRANVRSTWIVRQGEAFPRLVTCYVL